MKANVREKMDAFTNGDLKPSDEPEMGVPLDDPDEPEAEEPTPKEEKVSDPNK